MFPSVSMDVYRRGESGNPAGMKLALGASLARTLPRLDVPQSHGRDRRRTWTGDTLTSNIHLLVPNIFNRRPSDCSDVSLGKLTSLREGSVLSPGPSPRDSLSSTSPRFSPRQVADISPTTSFSTNNTALESEKGRQTGARILSLDETETTASTGVSPRTSRTRKTLSVAAGASKNDSTPSSRRRKSFNIDAAATFVRKMRHSRRRHSHQYSSLSVGSLGNSKSKGRPELKPLEKFRRVARTIRIITGTCIALKSYIRKSVSNEWSLVEMQLNLQADFNKLLAFNPQSFTKGPSLRTGEKLKKILAIPPHKRTAEHIQTILTLLRGNDSFEDYPIHTQVQLARCMVYQSYEARRIVVKEGHPPSSFYLILSGTVLINVRETHPKTGQPFVRTVHQMSRGEAFGEIALMNEEKRTSTIVCKTDVELLVIMKEHFDVIIKEPLEKQRDMHIDYCRNMELFKDFPCDVFKTALTHFFYQYFKTGMIVVKDSRKSNYVVVIKSGMCKVITNFRESPATQRKRRARVVNPKNELKDIFPLYADKVERDHNAHKSKMSFDMETGELRDVMKANLMTGETDHKKLTVIPKEFDFSLESKKTDDPKSSRRHQLRRHSSLTRLYDYLETQRKKDGIIVSELDGFWAKHLSENAGEGGPTPDRFGMTAEKIAEQERSITSKGFGRTWKRVTAAATLASQRESERKERENSGKLCYAQVAELQAGGVFGLENMLQKSTKSFTLVSGGAECILISKKLFLKEANAKVLRVVSDLVISYPSQRYVKQEIHSQRNWSKYKSELVKEIQLKNKP